MATEYDVLEIEVSRCLCDKPEVRILGSTFDRPRAPFTPPYDLAELTAQLDEFDDLLLRLNTPAISRKRKQIAEGIGLMLYKALLPGTVGTTFSRCISSVETARQGGQDVGQRIRISFGEASRYLPEIVGLPWELLCDPETMQFPGSEPQTPIVRYLDVSKRIKPLAVTPPLKVLAILSSPRPSKNLKLSPVDLPKHRDILRRAMSDQHWLKVHFLDPPTLENVRETLRKHKQQGKPFHAIHFLGHGDFNEDGEGVLYFETKERAPNGVTGQNLSKLLAGFEELSLAVLATCVGAQMLRKEGQHPFTGAASALILRVPAVVAMQFSISEEAASKFTSTFYQQIADGQGVDEAVTESRLAMAASDTDGFEWTCPVLFMRTPDGKILDIQPEAEVPLKRIAIFNVKDHDKDKVEVNDLEVDLRDYFVPPNDRAGVRRAHIANPAYWNAGVMDEMQRSLNRDLFQDAPYQLVIAAPISVAFAAGYLMHSRPAHQLVFRQRGQFGTSDWRFDGKMPDDAARWLPDAATREEIPAELAIDQSSADVAVVVELSRPTLPAVGTFLKDSPDAPKIGRIFYAKLDKSSGQGKVEDGAHAFQLAEELCNLVSAHTSARPGANVHWFISAPNSFNFAIGRLSRCFSSLQLYEFDFGGQGSGSGTYEPSITLPPKEAKALQ